MGRCGKHLGLPSYRLGKQLNKGLGQVREGAIFGTGPLPQVIEVRAVTHWGSLNRVPVTLLPGYLVTSPPPARYIKYTPHQVYVPMQLNLELTSVSSRGVGLSKAGGS